MIILLRNEMFNNKAKRKACAIRTHHVEFFPDMVEIIYPYGGDITYIPITKKKQDFVWGGKYAFCILYDDQDEYLIRSEYPKCKWFEEE